MDQYAVWEQAGVQRCSYCVQPVITKFPVMEDSSCSLASHDKLTDSKGMIIDKSLDVKSYCPTKDYLRMTLEWKAQERPAWVCSTWIYEHPGCVIRHGKSSTCFITSQTDTLINANTRIRHGMTTSITPTPHFSTLEWFCGKGGFTVEQFDWLLKHPEFSVDLVKRPFYTPRLPGNGVNTGDAVFEAPSIFLSSLSKNDKVLTKEEAEVEDEEEDKEEVDME